MDPMLFLVRLSCVLLVGIVLTLLLVTPVVAGKPGPTATHTVCVDAGHGGSDPGAVYHGLQEKVVTLDIAKRLEALLESSGFTVVMTREVDKALGNTARANICNEGSADTVLSIHLNAPRDGNSETDYFQNFYGKRRKDGNFTQTIWDNYNLTKPGSSELLPKRSPAQFASGLLLKTNGAASIAETVFLSNTQEAEALKQGTRQQEIAQELFDGLKAWYSR